MFEKARLSPAAARERAERAARALAADPRVRLIFFFGSAADPERTLPVRDVDLAVAFALEIRSWLEKQVERWQMG